VAQLFSLGSFTPGMKLWLYIFSAIALAGISVLCAFLACGQIGSSFEAQLRSDPELASLQPWAIKTIQRFHRGELLTNDAPRYASIGGCHLAASEIPEFIKKRWRNSKELGEAASLDMSVCVAQGSVPDVVMIHWLCYRVAVGPTNFVMPEKFPSWVKAKPGVYVDSSPDR